MKPGYKKRKIKNKAKYRTVKLNAPVSILGTKPDQRNAITTLYKDH